MGRQVKKFEGSIISEENNSKYKTSKLPNGDLILGGSENAPCEFSTHNFVPPTFVTPE